jgi:hypothetical protein
MRMRQHVGVDAQAKGRVAVSQVLRQFLTRSSPASERNRVYSASGGTISGLPVRYRTSPRLAGVPAASRLGKICLTPDR